MGDSRLCGRIRGYYPQIVPDGNMKGFPTLSFVSVVFLTRNSRLSLGLEGLLGLGGVLNCFRCVSNTK